MVADQLGVPMGDIEIIHGDTGGSLWHGHVWQPRSLSVGGSAIVTSTNKVREKMMKIAAHQLEARSRTSSYDTDGGKLYVKGSPSKSKSFFDVSFAAYTAHNLPDGVEPGLEETSFYDPSQLHLPKQLPISPTSKSTRTPAKSH